MFEVSILIPTQDNDGVAFTPSEDADFESAILDRFGGLTWRGSADGRWRDAAGIIVPDATRIVVVAVESIAQGAAVVEVAQAARTIYRQDAIYLYYLGQAEVIK